MGRGTMRLKPKRVLAIALFVGLGVAAYVYTQNPRGRSPRWFSPVMARFQQSSQPSPILLVQAPVLNPERFSASAGDPMVLRDYDPLTPIPATGQVTRRGNLAEAPGYLHFADCPEGADLYAVAQSSSYVIQVCAAVGDPLQPELFLAQAKDGSGTIQVISEDPQAAQQLIFRGDRYWYMLYRDGARPEILNAYLEIYTPEGRTYAEALYGIYEIR
jgi:hypothetical protein